MNRKEELKGIGKTVMITLGVVLVAKTFLFSPYTVEGASMEPTLHNHEKIFVNKMTNDFKRGDIVIIKGKKENYVKRIIGLPGDKIVMKDDKLYINDVLSKEAYLSQNRKSANQLGSLLTEDFGPITVPENQYFVMGDNRLRSMDSRNGLGYINKKQIVGETEFIFYPFNHVRSAE